MEAEPEDRIWVYGTSKAFRVRQIGRTFMVEQCTYTRDDTDPDKTIERWVTAAVAKTSDPTGMQTYYEALDWMLNAQREVWAMLAGDSGASGGERGDAIPPGGPIV